MKKEELCNNGNSNQRWIRAVQGSSRYPWCNNTVLMMANKAGAVSKIGRMVMIDTIKLDAYIESQASPEN